MSGVAVIDLPYPPSANRLWRYVGGRALKSAEYRAWEKAAMAAVIVSGAHRGHVGAARFQGPYGLMLAIGRPDNRRRDIDNLIKPVSDLLVSAGIVLDDSNCQRVQAEWVTGLVGIRATVIETLRVAA